MKNNSNKFIFNFIRTIITIGISAMVAYGEKQPKWNAILTEMTALREVPKLFRDLLKILSISFARIPDSAGRRCGISRKRII